MRAVAYVGQGKIEYKSDLFEMPVPGPGEVLIKVECSVLNPSDLYMMNGEYGTFSEPIVPGNEGSGTVIGHGGGWYAWSFMGYRVGFSKKGDKPGKPPNRYGSYGEYIVTPAFQCITLGKDTSWEQGACSFVNPVTAIGLLAKCKEYKAKAVIQNGAASQLGRMMVKVFDENKIPLINIVRRKEQVELLENEYNAKYVLNSSDDDFDAKLKELATQLNATVCLECVAGDMPGRILQVMPRGAVLINYGQLSEQNIGPLNPMVLIFKNQRLESFLLPYWLQSQSLWGQMQALRASKKLTSGVAVSKCYGLHQVSEAIEYYRANMTAGKVFLKPELTE